MESTRRRFLASLSTIGLGSTLVPDTLWGRMQEAQETRITAAMLEDALAIAGLEFTEEEREAIVGSVNRSLDRYEAIREIPIPDDVAPPIYFSPLVPGMEIDRESRPFRPSPRPTVSRPADLEDVAFWPVTRLAELVRTRQVTSVELTEMYLARLRRYNDLLRNVVTSTDDRAMRLARRADEEIAAGRYRGPLHGIPWGAKDIIAVDGYKNAWGAEAYQNQVSDSDATLVQRLDEAGAVLVAKLTTGELAHGDQWFGGRTNNPWNPEQGSSGSSAGPGSATAAGGVGFAIGTDTAGSIMSPSARCGLSGLVPTFGRISRHGLMTLNWTLDRVGPMCRSVEDCALVAHAVAGPDGHDLAVTELPFNYDAQQDVRGLRIGYLEGAFDQEGRRPDWVANDLASLDQLRSMGFDLVPVTVPTEVPSRLISMAVESAAFFDELLRSGRAALTTDVRQNAFRSNRVVPAVEYLQTQRVRAIMMRHLAEATAGVDVYLAPSFEGDGRGGGGGRSLASEHFQLANAAGYPEIAVPNGFSGGTPTSISFMARPYGEAAMLAVAKAYQDATGFHERHPTLG